MISDVAIHAIRARITTPILAAARIVGEIAAANRAKLGQIALAWLLQKGDDLVPIPGTKRRKYLEENVAAENVQLDPLQMKVLDDALTPAKVSGQRYADWIMAPEADAADRVKSLSNGLALEQASPSGGRHRAAIRNLICAANKCYPVRGRATKSLASSNSTRSTIQSFIFRDVAL